MGSFATAGGQRDLTGFAAVRTIIETVGAKTHAVLALADGAVPFTDAALFRQVALRAMGQTWHRGPLRKLYLSMAVAARRR